LQAIPRRGFHGYLFPFKYIVNTELNSRPSRVRWRLILAVGAMTGWARGLGGPAMVAGMAMAAWAKGDIGVGRKFTRLFCTTHEQATWRGARLNSKGHRIVGFMIRPFTPIHTRLPKLLTWIFGVNVWGCLPLVPRRIVANSCGDYADTQGCIVDGGMVRTSLVTMINGGTRRAPDPTRAT
jgi:hypothetical protein